MPEADIRNNRQINYQKQMPRTCFLPVEQKEYSDVKYDIFMTFVFTVFVFFNHEKISTYHGSAEYFIHKGLRTTWFSFCRFYGSVEYFGV